MSAQIISSSQEKVVVTIELLVSGSMLDQEEHIQDALNEAGILFTSDALQRFDADGSPLIFGSTKWTSKGLEPKHYQTPYGEVKVARHVYQTAQGGATYCPLDRDARIVVSSTPRFAKQVTNKYAQMAAPQVVSDLKENHGRTVTHPFIQHVCEAVGSVAQAKEEDWHYAAPELDEPVASIAIGMDGTCMLMCRDGYRETMVGNLSLYNAQGERLYTTYVGATPEYGKATFKGRMEREIAQVKKHYPTARMIGVADGAAENWIFLEQHTEDQVLDFYHASEYVGKVAQAIFSKKSEREPWLGDRLHRLKHKQGAAGRLIKEMEGFEQREKLSKRAREDLAVSLTYFRNHKHQMNYARYRAKGWPIGSGVTEAACKTLVKQRLCASGMRWKEKGAAVVLSLRCLIRSTGRWQQFWGKINQYGFPVVG